MKAVLNKLTSFIKSNRAFLRFDDFYVIIIKFFAFHVAYPENLLLPFNIKY
jgi:hypothetical protein